jgi:hypothetical protein
MSRLEPPLPLAKPLSVALGGTRLDGMKPLKAIAVFAGAVLCASAPLR